MNFFLRPAGEDTTLLMYRGDLSSQDKERVLRITKKTEDFSKPEKFELMQGEAGTSKKIPDRGSFSHPASNMSFEQESLFRIGDGFFKKIWIASPSSIGSSDGLGPLFNARSCQSYHLKDRRGHPPENKDDATSMFLRLARKARNGQEAELYKNKDVLNFSDSTYGQQLQDKAIKACLLKGV